MTDAVEAPATTPASGAEPAPSQAPAVEQPNTPPAAAPQPAEEGSKPEAPVIPEKYEFSNLPEGYTLDEAALGEWSGVFKELGLTQEQAQKLVEMDAKRYTAANSPEAQRQAAIEARNSHVAQWETAVKQDKELGGAKLAESLSIAQKALTDFGTPELSAMLKESGLGSHPEVVRFFHKVGKELSEGKLHRAATDVPAERSIAERMYPNYPK
ncbi:peptidase [Pseudomonas typographi]|uniref:peptidase n=1 Tax=Pseudomonas typographi TaxID=2715964 RepID=UPI001682FD8B|nr:peptidase [Pseudomonas typographi]MBD1555014.1 peptidase [Pseudomonas typographi]